MIKMRATIKEFNQEKNKQPKQKRKREHDENEKERKLWRRRRGMNPNVYRGRSRFFSFIVYGKKIKVAQVNMLPLGPILTTKMALKLPIT